METKCGFSLRINDLNNNDERENDLKYYHFTAEKEGKVFTSETKLPTLEPEEFLKNIICNSTFTPHDNHTLSVENDKSKFHFILKSPIENEDKITIDDRNNEDFLLIDESNSSEEIGNKEVTIGDMSFSLVKYNKEILVIIPQLQMGQYWSIELLDTINEHEPSFDGAFYWSGSENNVKDLEDILSNNLAKECKIIMAIGDQARGLPYFDDQIDGLLYGVSSILSKFVNKEQRIFHFYYTENESDNQSYTCVHSKNVKNITALLLRNSEKTLNIPEGAMEIKFQDRKIPISAETSSLLIEINGAQPYQIKVMINRYVRPWYSVLNPWNYFNTQS